MIARIDLRSMFLSTALLALFAVVGTGLVAFVHDSTKERIAANERAVLLRRLHEIMPDSRYDNDILADVMMVSDDALDPSLHPRPVYLAWKNGTPVGSVLTAVAPDGYNGEIKILVGAYIDDTVSGVRVVAHRETPGLGDDIDIRRSDWILGFEGRSLGNPPEERWKVKRDGGDFDQFTGATITPRAVVAAVRRALLYFREHKDPLFADRESLSGNE